MGGPLHFWDGHIGWMWFWWIVALLLVALVVHVIVRGLARSSRR